MDRTPHACLAWRSSWTIKAASPSIFTDTVHVDYPFVRLLVVELSRLT